MAPVSNARNPTLFGWGLAIAASLLLFWFSRGTPVYHFAVGLMVSVFALAIALALFECVWQAAVYGSRALGLVRP
jgi:hypothetical protein